MSPTETSPLSDYLEHPAEAFAYYQKQGVTEVVCEEKHMGSRAVVIITQTDSVAVSRFGLETPSPGVCYTRTGRPFFNELAIEQAFIGQIRAALTEANFWETFQTDWVCLDAELMPWSAKAQSLIREQYAAVGISGKQALDAVKSVLSIAAERGLPVADLQSRFGRKAIAADLFGDSYRRYCRPTNGLEGLVLAPFHLLATEGKVHIDQPHTWHMDQLAAICRAGETVVPGFLLATPYLVVNLDDSESVAAATAWWEQLTGIGGEGMVVKPLNYIARHSKGMVQPAVKCRGIEYLRIIYGPEYNIPQNLNRLKDRGLSTKRGMALKEFALGLEAMERFVAREPLRRVHECVFAVLALESEEVDPRL